MQLPLLKIFTHKNIWAQTTEWINQTNLSKKWSVYWCTMADATAYFFMMQGCSRLSMDNEPWQLGISQNASWWWEQAKNTIILWTANKCTQTAFLSFMSFWNNYVFLKIICSPTYVNKLYVHQPNILYIWKSYDFKSFTTSILFLGKHQPLKH